MQIGSFRKNVMKTVAVKSTKLGLRTVAKNTLRTNVLHASVSLKTSIGSLLQDLTGYLLGQQMTAEMKQDAQITLGDIGYDLVILCRVLKVKMPAATKKSKLAGSWAAALLELDSLGTDLLKVIERGAFLSPKLKHETKMMVMPNKGGVKEERTVEVIDKEADEKAEASRQEQSKALLTPMVALFWRLNYAILQKPPVSALTDKFIRLQAEFPDVVFDTAEPVKKPKAVKAPVAAAQQETVPA